jgi:hypothetical protein
MWTLLGIGDTFDGDRHSPVWVFRSQTRDGYLQQSAMQMAGVLASIQLKKENQPIDVNSVELRATKIYPVLYQSLKTLDQLPKEEQIKALGSDPDAITREQYIDTMNNLHKMRSD